MVPASPSDLGIHRGVPPHVVHVDRHPDKRRREPLGHRIGLRQRARHRAVARVHRVQRLDGQPHAALRRVRQHRPDPVLDHLPGAVQIAVRRRPSTPAPAPAAPSAAASSMARRLSSIRCWRSSALAAGKKPPRHRLETLRPAPVSRRAVSARPISATLWRHSPIQPTPARAQPSIVSAMPQFWVVA